ncbi:MAG: hypothetical protein RKO25_00695 [Candidatus Contendobacter sp.]|nr:hypothetical protein [Candidatus Contendobacter sp.]
MKYSIYLSKDDKKQLEYEVVSQEFRVHLTRLIERNENFARHYFINQNWLINRSRTLVGKTVYVLQADDMGGYEDCEYAWHNGEFELCFRRLDTNRLIELLCEVVDRKWLLRKDVNHLLGQEGASFRLTGGAPTGVEVISVEKLEEDAPQLNEHPNIRALVNRMVSSLDNSDYAGVLHSSASIFETLAKDVVGIPSVQDQTLASFFDRYKKDSQLPTELQAKILDTYKSRNSTPLAGHGSTQAPSITKEEAVTLCELTKAFVRIEYHLLAEKADAKS